MIEIWDVFQIRAIHTAFWKRLDREFFFTGESHNFWEMVFVIDGEIGITSGSDVFLLKKGRAIIHAPMEFHSLWSEGGKEAEIIIFSFSAVNVPAYSMKLFEMENVRLPRRILAELENAFTIDGICVKGVKESAYPASQIALKRFELFLLDVLSQRPAQTMVVKSGTAKNYNAIVTVLENNVDKSLMVADIAKMCGMSEINLKKTFSRYAGIGVMQYFNRIKINRPTHLLREGKAAKEVATELGFANQNYFSTVFKRITGCAPTEYIKNMKESENSI